MKTLIIVLMLALFAIPCSALEVTSITFSIASSASTSTANLRITPMKQKMANFSGKDIQAFAIDSSATLNYFLTKSTMITIDGSWGALWIQTDQDTTMKKNSDAYGMKIYSNVDKVIGLK